MVDVNKGLTNKFQKALEKYALLAKTKTILLEKEITSQNFPS